MAENIFYVAAASVYVPVSAKYFSLNVALVWTHSINPTMVYKNQIEWNNFYEGIWFIYIHEKYQYQVAENEKVSSVEEMTFYLGMYSNISIMSHINFRKNNSTRRILYCVYNMR